MLYNFVKRTFSTAVKHPYHQLTFTQTLTPIKEMPKISTFRLLDLEGKLLDKNHTYDTSYLLKILKSMIFVDEMDNVLLKVKSQGKISFYMTSFGEHACIIGTAAALTNQDLLYTQYREQGAHFWRGYTIENIINQCIGNIADGAKGRQMPVHYGMKEINNITVSSPLGTQITQAAGSGYALRTAKEKKIVACFFGEGCASEGDFPTALNFAATLRCQTLFLCRNNGYAISTPLEDQYASDGVMPRAVAYGIASARVDGNDILACLHAAREAKKYIIETGKPYFIQFMTYRMGDHSTSDNSALYRSEQQKKVWRETTDPIKRLIKFLKNVNCTEIPDEEAERGEVRKIVSEALKKCYKHKYPTVLSLFDDVYDKLPPHLLEQRADLKAHLQAYGHKYDYLDKYSKE